MNKIAEDFKTQAEAKNIMGWPIHNCSMCGYPCGYYFRDGEVLYDNGCDCTRGSSLRQSSWEEVADHYNLQSHSSVIEKMNEFWGFQNQNQGTT